MINENILYAAIKSAGNVSFQKFRHGCVIFNNRRVISTGHNKKTPNTKISKYGYYNCWVHAEADAILKSREPLNGASLLVIRAGKTTLGNSKPCKHCMALIADVGIKNVYYSDRDGHIVYIRL